MRLLQKIMRKCSYKRQTSQKAELDHIVSDLEYINASNSREYMSLIRRLKRIDDEIIHYGISMAEMPLIVYLLSLKHDGQVKIELKGQDGEIYIGGRYIANMSYLAVYIHFIEVREGILHIEGNVSQPAILQDRCSFGIFNNGQAVKCELFDRGLDLKKGSNVYEIRTAYTADIELSPEGNRIVFCNYIDGHECIYGKINAMRFSPVADCIDQQYCIRDGEILYIERNELCCKKADDIMIQQHEEEFQKELLANHEAKAKWAISLRTEYFDRRKNKKKPIWLFMDRSDRADDNAEALYRYVRGRDEIEAYFIIKRDTKDWKRLQPLGNIIEANSREHLMLVLLADYIISSQANGIVENPFWGDAEFVRDLYHQAKIVFLQHGVIKDDMSRTLNRYNTNFTGFITSSPGEWRSILEYPYFYSKEQVWLTGLPRFDLLYNNPQNYILIMPSWRQGLMCQEWDEDADNMVWKLRTGFLKSNYVKKYCSLLNNKALKAACKEYGYKLAFMPHALMEPYIDNFIQDNECEYWDSNKSYRDAFAEGNLLVTDYSSVAFDFAYLQKPILYYQFDKEQFFQEHTYKQGYYDYENDGLGEVAYKEKELVQFIIGYMSRECKVKEKYKKRMQETFEYGDKNNCERVYERLMGL